MKSTQLVSASVLALAALASASSFAQDSNYPGNEVSATSTLSRADVRAELLQSPRASYQVNGDSNYPATNAAPVAGTKSRAEVRAELEQAQHEGYKLSIDNTYPANTNVPGAISRIHSAG
ncbi:MAG: DUF4148 domain-containing protein [Polaromonas sp.]|uniref:DUF4148 domain-containing protein n=1 Tax=Polaromonas sp. TaxID=1869339 RepID=UPI0032671759